MDEASFLTPAVRCVQALQACSVTQEQLFQNPRNSSLASAISMLSHTAQFIDRAVQCDDNLHDIGIFIACSIKRQEGAANKDPTFLLWNSMRNTQTCRSTRLEIDSSRQGRSNNQTTNTGTAGGGIHFAPSQAQETNESLQASHKPRETTAPERAQSKQGPPPAQLPQNPDPLQNDCYSVPVTIAAKCLELLLDGSGFSSHKNIFQKRSYTELGTKPLVDAVKEVFKAEQKDRVSKKDGSKLPMKANAKDDMIYCDLLPDHLRSGNDTNKQTFVSVPEVVLEERGHVTVPQYLKDSMDIRKPDRNKKHQNFAVLCVLLDHTGPTGVCAKTLREYARLEFTVEGCRRRKKYSTSSKATCNSSNSSCHDSRALCSFMISSDNVAVGKGSVDPFVAVHDGKKVTEESILVRFASVRAFEDIKFPTSLKNEEKISMHRHWANGIHTIWQKARIKRIELLGDFQKAIGTAILVQHLIPIGAHQSILKRIKRSCNKRNNLEVSNAIVVCDIRLENNDKTAASLYPYMEWYNLSCFKMLKDLHFCGEEPPKVLSCEFLRSAKALLWNKNHYRELE